MTSISAPSQVDISNVGITNDDGCVAFKPGVDCVNTIDITCIRIHSLSIGSLGKGSGDTVKNVYVLPATTVNSAKDVGIKAYRIRLEAGMASRLYRR